VGIEVELRTYSLVIQCPRRYRVDYGGWVYRIKLVYKIRNNIKSPRAAAD